MSHASNLSDFPFVSSLLPPAGETSLLLRFHVITLGPLDNLPIVRLIPYLYLQSCNNVFTGSKDWSMDIFERAFYYHIREEELDSTFRQGQQGYILGKHVGWEVLLQFGKHNPPHFTPLLFFSITSSIWKTIRRILAGKLLNSKWVSGPAYSFS